MKTADLIESLAAEATPVRRARPGRRVGGMLGAGAVLALAVLVPWLGVSPVDPMARLPFFCMKATYTGSLALAGWALTARLSRPGGSARAPAFAVLIIVASMISMGAMQLAMTPHSDWRRIWLGETWDQCPFRIVALAVPIFVLVILGVRRLAPTSLRATGAAAGLLAGAAAATVYGLYCDESTAAFTATWYTLGIAACAGVGALTGPRLLRW